jgi:adenylate kinase
MKAGTELGKMASSIMAAGGLITDEITNGIVKSRISQADCAGGFLLDGYPRTVPQAEYLTGLLKELGLEAPIVIHLDVPAESLVKRLTARRQCPTCKRIYNMLSQPPKVEGVCDADGAALFTRADDQEATIRERLDAYEKLTGPILNFYGPAKVQTVDGTQPMDAVGKAIVEAVLKASGK